MDTANRLDELLKHPPLILPLSSPIVFISDLHMGGGDPADNFCKNEDICLRMIRFYASRGFGFVLAGDILELWQFTPQEILKAHPGIIREFEALKVEGRCIQLEGNHDRELGYPEAIIIKDSPIGPVLILHGHQGGFFEDRHWKLGRIFTRYIWKPLEWIGFQDPTSASKNSRRHETVRKALSEWANGRGIHLIAGHTHRQEQDGFYWNIGSGITPGRVECIEWDGEFKLKKWGNLSLLDHL